MYTALTYRVSSGCSSGCATFAINRNANREEDKVELKKLRAAVTHAASIGADRERLKGVVAQCHAEIAEQVRLAFGVSCHVKSSL